MRTYTSVTIIWIVAIATSSAYADQYRSDLIEQMRLCLQKKYLMLQQCNPTTHFALMRQLREYDRHKNCPRQAKIIQRKIAFLNNQFLLTMSPEQKADLKQIVAEYRKLHQNLCSVDPRIKERQHPEIELCFF